MKIKTMKSKIRKPVLILIITVPLITLILFNIFIHIYTNQIAKKELQVMSKTMETVVKREFLADSSNLSTNKLDKTFAKLYGYVRWFYPGDEASKIDWNSQQSHKSGFFFIHIHIRKKHILVAIQIPHVEYDHSDQTSQSCKVFVLVRFL